MPLYEYQCDACAHRFEQIQRFADPLLTACPRCSGGVRKLVSSPAIQFKGTGWYVTDYARQGAKDPSAAESKAEAPSDGAASKSKKQDAGKPGDSTGRSAPPADSAKSPGRHPPAPAPRRDAPPPADTRRRSMHGGRLRPAVVCRVGIRPAPAPRRDLGPR